MKKSAQENLKELVREMDDVVTEISADVELLNDIEVTFGQLKVSMDTAAYNGDERFYYHVHHREVRLLSELMHHVMERLTKAQEKSKVIHLAIFEKVVKGGKEGEESIGA